jgi:NAD(P)-dependent dehydrogenase (short-subunit alcohol dehydrogenase family)
MEKVALITGIRRVGKEIARRLLEKGYGLSVVYKSSSEEVKELEKIAGELGGNLLPLKVDLSDPDSYSSIVEKTVSHFGRIDAFLHLASPYFRTPIVSLSREDFYTHFLPIAEAFLFISRDVFREMLKNEGAVKGRIVAFGDWAVEHTPYKNYSAYFISKGALHGAVKVLAKEFAPHVLVNCVALGPTLKAEDLTDEEWRRIINNTPLKRPVQLEDVISLVDFFLRAESITGEIVLLDGGRHIAGSGTGGAG